METVPSPPHRPPLPADQVSRRDGASVRRQNPTHDDGEARHQLASKRDAEIEPAQVAPRALKQSVNSSPQKTVLPHISSAVAAPNPKNVAADYYSEPRRDTKKLELFRGSSHASNSTVDTTPQDFRSTDNSRSSAAVAPEGGGGYLVEYQRRRGVRLNGANKSKGNDVASTPSLPALGLPALPAQSSDVRKSVFSAPSLSDSGKKIVLPPPVKRSQDYPVHPPLKAAAPLHSVLKPSKFNRK